MRLIDADAFLEESIESKRFVFRMEDMLNQNVVIQTVYEDLARHLMLAPTIEAEPVRHGRWELEVRSFYMDNYFEDIELAVYILASCSECGEKHPNANQVFSKTLYAPDDAADDFRFDREAEEAKALEAFKQRNYSFAHYCPNCGAKMDE